MEISSTQIKTLEQAIGYHFNNQDFLTESLSHPSLKQHSAKSGSVKNYERLELLGDSILSFVITEILFKNYSNHAEGKLAKIRSHLICKEMLCNVASKLDLAEYIIMTHGEEVSGGRTNPNNIENAMEALIAAVYLDSDIATTKVIINNLWSEFLSSINLVHLDPKTTLQEFGQSKFGCKPKYEIVKREGLAHSSIFTVMVQIHDYQETAQGHSVKAAEKEAAQKLLNSLGITQLLNN